MSIKLKFILWGLLFYLSTGFLLYHLLEVNKWYFVAGEVLLLLSLVLFIILYGQLVKPIETISSAIHLLKEKDFSTRLSPVKQKEIDQLIDVFNKMSEQLHLERVEHEEKNLFLDRLIEASPSAILILNTDNDIERMNPAARQLFQLSNEKHTTINFSQLPPPWTQKLQSLNEEGFSSIKLDGVRRFKASYNTFMDKGFSRPFILIEEMTRELVQAERQSYEKVIRMMSHEVNNSVGAVNSVMQSVLGMSEQLDENIRQDVEHALQISMDRNKSLNRFMANFADVVKLPLPDKKEVDLAELIKKVIPLFNASFQMQEIQYIDKSSSYFIYADGIQIEQVLVNIIKNSVEAISSRGIIQIEINDNRLSILDNGGGFTKETIEKLFTPFYSTKQTGQGIGLTLVREILINHGFSFKLHRKDKVFTEFLILFGE
ncbi:MULTISPECIES: PAS domain-containing sensor histidine kinase [unclassified Lentimicrobium]|uniref:sensor histidine kinase n=1 Tax=unclassified Lentimicrobium TaxID=2677434 RepID=UPI001556DB08|nr:MULTISPECIES: ATP-binding protein [unclassified Lentimicrobium]NPD44172.1 HAMP domain-containing protein [Lentimicrobium sp. S6]NPD84630.1 HAMP domain-containing protein [Lentimicrobium sp. L6]